MLKRSKDWKRDRKLRFDEFSGAADSQLVCLVCMYEKLVCSVCMYDKNSRRHSSFPVVCDVEEKLGNFRD
jgi:hypothetical protein